MRRSALGDDCTAVANDAAVAKDTAVAKDYVFRAANP